jgi:hypothetical protein
VSKPNLSTGGIQSLAGKINLKSKNTKIIIAAVAVIIVGIIIINAVGSGNSSIVGTWQTIGSYPIIFFEFNKDGSFYLYDIPEHRYEDEKMQYKISGKKLQIIDIDGDEFFNDTFEIEGNILNLIMTSPHYPGEEMRQTLRKVK